MSKGLKLKFGALGVSSLLLIGVAVAAVGITGAYFSESKAGEVKGNSGSIHIATSGGSGENKLTFDFANLLPGEPQSATVQYKNTGKNAEDVWIVFNNAEALHALNNLGSYGEVTITDGAGTVFHSTNLNDNLPPASKTCGPFSESGCWPLQEAYKVGSDIAPGAGGYARFTFAYASKMSSPENEDQPFNTYPPEAAKHGEEVKGSGLPYEIVATQVGQAP